ncbi:hypothetical protein NLG97_g3866 [Lecanicillium saksenae]|uniref:Uncharacterized protein n=1 Tax=Lecanicillium saksenae TaxID=468837 RepID=A0ACC1QY98_9HYPO|nr:hypothetical protein NLG97_g3866 [Lecanicillium saksenae]
MPTMTRKQPIHTSQWIIVPLSVVMVAFATFAFTGVPGAPLKDTTVPVFTTTRMEVSCATLEFSRHTANRVAPQTGEHFLTFRRRTSPALIYQGLHALPALIWSVMMPLQHVDWLRKKWPALHRSSGYAILSGSLILGLTGTWFISANHAHTHPNLFHLHTINGWAVVGWPTFALTILLITPWYFVTMYKTAVTARKKDFLSHRKWAVLHTMIAYTISLERVGVIVFYAFGWILTFFPKEKVHGFFNNLPDTDSAIAEAELDIFALTNLFGLLMFFTWTAFELGRVGVWRRARIDSKKTN